MLQSKKSLRLSFLFALWLPALGCDPGAEAPQQRREPPMPVLDQDTAHLEVIPRLIWSRGLGTQRVSIVSEQFPLELELYENRQVVDVGTILVRDGKEVPFSDSGLDYPLAGRVVGDSESRVRLVKTEGGLQGVIFTQGKVLELRDNPSNAQTQRFGEARGMGEYAHGQESDARCGLDAVSDESAEHVHEGGILARENGCKRVDIVMVADYSFIDDMGGSVQAAEKEIVKRMGEVDAIYRKYLGVQFRISKIYSYPDSSDPLTPEFNRPESGFAPLDEFTRWKSEHESKSDLAYLMIQRTTLGVVGLANMGSLCRGVKSAAVGNYLGPAQSSSAVIAHEIGHVFGARHVTNPDRALIMAANGGGPAEEFADASVRAIKSRIGRVSCLETVKCESGETIGPSPDPSPGATSEGSTSGESTTNQGNSRSQRTSSSTSGELDLKTTRESQQSSSEPTTTTRSPNLSESDTVSIGTSTDEHLMTDSDTGILAGSSSSPESNPPTDVGEADKTRIVIEGCAMGGRRPTTWLVWLLFGVVGTLRKRKSIGES